MPLLDPKTLDQLLTMMYNINPYLEMFKMARDMMATKSVPTDLKLCFIASWTKDAHRYNVLMVDEINALMVGDGSEVVDRCDIVITQQVGLSQRISKLHVGYMVLHYPLLFPYGEDGWHPNISFNGVVVQDVDVDLDEDHEEKYEHQRKHHNVTMAKFYGYQFQHQNTNGIMLLQGSRLK